MELFKKKEEQPPAQDAPNAAPEQKSGGLGGLFQGGKQNEQQQAAGADASKEMNTLSRRMRINEERSVNIRKKTQMIEHNMITNHKKLLSEIKYVNEEIADIKREFEELKAHVRSFSRELQESAKKEDVQVLERYINLWQPVEFVTRNEVEKIVKEIMNQKQ